MALFGGRRRNGGEADRSDVGEVGTRHAGRSSSLGPAHIGPSLEIEGDLRGNEDLVIDGRVRGRLELPGGELTVGPSGHVRAEVSALRVVVQGRLEGNVHALERVEIQASGVIEGDVRAPRLVVAEGGVLNGAIAMDAPTEPS